MSAGDPPRRRNLTEKGKELYESNQKKHITSINKVWEPLENIFTEFSEYSKDLKSLRETEKSIVSYRNTYIKKSEEYVDFLNRTGTDESVQTLHVFEVEFKKCVVIVDNFLEQIKQLKLDAAETLSRASGNSAESTASSSKRSVTSSKLAKKRLNAEVQRTKLHYLEQQANLLEQKAKIEAELSLINQKSEMAIAEVELQAVEQEDRQSLYSNREGMIRVEKESLKSIKQNLTEQYVVDQLRIKVEKDDVQESKQEQAGQQDNFSLNTPNPRPAITTKPTPLNLSKPHYDIRNVVPIPYTTTLPLNPYASDFQPRINSNVVPENQNRSVVSDFTKFLLKKDLLLSRFQQFDDKPESYASWKASFASITTELEVTAFEEMDLLIKWLGPESSRFSQTIRASNVNNPQRGLERIWSRLEERFGKPELVENAIKSKLSKFPKLTNKDSTRYFDLLDILTQIESSKENVQYSTLLSYYDSSSGVLPIIEKLPYNVQEKWTNHASRYKMANNVPFPPFSVFVDFIRDISTVKNDPAFMYQNTESTSVRKPHDVKRNQASNTVFNRKTKVTEVKTAKAKETSMKSNRCPVHNANHSLTSCRAFRAMKVDKRRQLLKDHKICFKCCSSTKHIYRNCDETVKCDTCGSNTHITLMHSNSHTADGGEKAQNRTENDQDEFNVLVKCTSVPQFSGRSCGKVVKVRVFRKGFPEKATHVYAILDDQSNKTLAKSELFDKLGVNSDIITYTMSSCTGSTRMKGRFIDTLIVESLCSDDCLEIKSVIECSAIPEDRSEIPTPDIAKMYKHLSSIANEIPDIDSQVNVQLLIGRDIPEVHHVHKQLVGPKGLPFAQKLIFGWVIIGEVCLGKVHRPISVVTNKTTVLNNGRGTIFEPCPNTLYVKKHCTDEQADDELRYDLVFQVTKNDDKIGLSVEDNKFLDLMNSEFKKDVNGHWTAPLPFRSDKRNMPNNRSQAWRRAQILDSSLRKNPVKRQHFLEFMQKVLDSGAAEIAPPISNDKERWYLPLFGVYHPNKPDRIRGVFDSSATFEGVSLNQMLMSGPDLTNNLLGILLRFRKDKVAAIADIEQMFYQFYVDTKDRDFLRFFWYHNNNPDNELIEYRMRVHVFGNSPSPAIATFGLRKTVETCNADIKQFVCNNFYVDDGLISLPDSQQVIDILKRTQESLKIHGQIRLHKIASNSSDVLKAFPKQDISSDLSTLDIGESKFPPHASLGLTWDLNNDTFIFLPFTKEKPCTRRGILSSLNSIFDPIGFLSPITISGKILLREVCPSGFNWDDPLEPRFQVMWNNWRASILSLTNLLIPRMYFDISASEVDSLETHIFADASEQAIAASAYLRTIDNEGRCHVGFLLGKAKLSPQSGNTIPRLELCAAVLASELGTIVAENMKVLPESIKYYSDSKVVLGYLNNMTRRFHTYVSNRVSRILKVTSSDQWNYVPTHLNPADCSTRFISSIDLKESAWLRGPDWLTRTSGTHSSDNKEFPLVNPELDKEIRIEVKTMNTSVLPLMVSRFEKFSNWKKLVKAVAFLQHMATAFHRSNLANDTKCSGWHVCQVHKSVETYALAEILILKEFQKEAFAEEIECLNVGQRLSKKSSIVGLSPFLDSSGLLRVGGRLSKGFLPKGEINPIIIPRNTHIAKLLIDHFHASVKHQGRLLTEGVLRRSGYWLIGAKRSVSSFIHKCVTCRKLRGKLQTQKMADLPTDRLTPGPPFTCVGVDTFGPWHVLTRKTRGGSSNSKRWALLFTCMTTRAIHIEVIETLSSSSFINALRRFQSLRGPVKVYRSDCGTNFKGATDDLNVEAINVQDKAVKTFLCDSGSVWKFNPPHSSHMGGVWERMIGLTRRILDGIILASNMKTLTHECLVTFMAEVVAIINSRPIAQISTDPENPSILSPSMLLTGKEEYLPVIAESYDLKDMYRAQWKHVQVMSDIFWKRWRNDYLHSLQNRQKWQNVNDNMKIGDVVYLREKSTHRGEWPLGIISDVFCSDDDLVRKVSVRVCKDGKITQYIRPINELVLLVD